MMRYNNVLHIDDDPDDLEIFSTTVDEFKPPVNCISLSCAATALKKIISRELSPEVIFLDLNMPGMDGFEFLRAVKGLHGFNAPVYILSTSSQPETISSAKKLGADDYLIKPSTMKQFVQLLTPFFG
ncbi:MAG TPA: response regulator [Flavobacterium sp.]|uniref:response regulator n=1 Tax=Flavobacterium sp. TaxID=239 RepID=UPI002C73F1E1|nr:response regulator [Flavobacterium sp.]HNP33903.1 response regulator [Flavobacterium sp.]